MNHGSSDWTFLPLREIDVLLRCPICKDYFNNAVLVANCSHHFCSFCIRKFLHVKRQCPLCSKVVNESDILKNQLLDQLVQTFTRNRQHFIDLLPSSNQVLTNSTSTGHYSVPLPPTLSELPEFADESQAQIINQPPVNNQSTRDAADQRVEPCSPVTPLQEAPMNISDVVGDVVSAASQEDSTAALFALTGAGSQCTENGASISSQSSAVAQTDGIVAAIAPVSSRRSSNNILNDSLLAGEKTGSKVSCPVCNKQVLPTFINSHLDSCLNKTPSLTNKPLNTTTQGGSKLNQKLPNYVYSVMKDKELRKKLKTYGLSSQGSRHELVERLKEFVLRYNAQCDSTSPKSREEVAAEVERAERSKVAANKGGPSSVPRRKSSTNPIDIDQQNKAHEKAHASQYAELIAKARESRDRASRTKSLMHTHPAKQSDETITPNQTTPPLSPTPQPAITPIVITTPMTKTLPLLSNSTPAQGRRSSRVHSTPTSTTSSTPTIHHRIGRRLTPPTTSHRLTSMKTASGRPDLFSTAVSSQSPAAGNTSGASNKSTSHRQVEEGETECFDDLSPFDNRYEVCSDGSTPELELAVQGREVFVPESPEDQPVTKQSGKREGTIVPERSLRSNAKRKHAIRNAPVVMERENSDIGISSPKSRKKQKRI